MGVLYTALIGFGCISHSLQKGYLYIYTYVGLSALYQRCTLKDDIFYLLPTSLSVGTRKYRRKHHFVG